MEWIFVWFRETRLKGWGIKMKFLKAILSSIKGFFVEVREPVYINGFYGKRFLGYLVKETTNEDGTISKWVQLS